MGRVSGLENDETVGQRSSRFSASRTREPRQRFLPAEFDAIVRCLYAYGYNPAFELAVRRGALITLAPSPCPAHPVRWQASCTASRIAFLSARCSLLRARPWASFPAFASMMSGAFYPLLRPRPFPFLRLQIPGFRTSLFPPARPSATNGCECLARRASAKVFRLFSPYARVDVRQLT